MCSGGQPRSEVERRTPRSGAYREASYGAKRHTSPVVSMMRRLDNGDDFRQGRRGYCIEVGGGGTLGMMTVAFDGGWRRRQEEFMALIPC